MAATQLGIAIPDTEVRLMMPDGATAQGRAPAREQWPDLLGLSSTETAEPVAPVVSYRPGRDFPKWANQSIESEAESRFPDEANTRVQALMLARRNARDEALQRLADGAGTNISGLLRSSLTLLEEKFGPTTSHAA